MGVKRKLTSSETKINKENRKFSTKIKKFVRGYSLFSKIKIFPTIAIWVPNESLRAQKQKEIGAEPRSGEDPDDRFEWAALSNPRISLQGWVKTRSD